MSFTYLQLPLSSVIGKSNGSHACSHVNVHVYSYVNIHVYSYVNIHVYSYVKASWSLRVS